MTSTKGKNRIFVTFSDGTCLEIAESPRGEKLLQITSKGVDLKTSLDEVVEAVQSLMQSQESACAEAEARLDFDPEIPF